MTKIELKKKMAKKWFAACTKQMGKEPKLVGGKTVEQLVEEGYEFPNPVPKLAPVQKSQKSSLVKKLEEQKAMETLRREMFAEETLDEALDMSAPDLAEDYNMTSVYQDETQVSLQSTQQQVEEVENGITTEPSGANSGDSNGSTSVPNGQQEK